MVAGNQSSQVDMGVGGRAPARHGNISEDSGVTKMVTKTKSAFELAELVRNGTAILATETMGN